MAYDPNQHQRRSIRLGGYDYAGTGAYFVTVCTEGHTCLFGRVVGDAMEWNNAGRMVEQCWREIPAHFPQVTLDEFIVMPNHVHGILVIADANDDSPGPGAASVVGANNHSPLQGRANSYSPLRERANGGSPSPSDHASQCAGDNPPVRANDYSPVQMQIRANDDSPLRTPRPRGTSQTIGSILRGFKIGVAKWMRENSDVRDVWQRNYFEHIIRNDVARNRIRQYIMDNPPRWACDRYNPEAVNPETEDPWRE